MEEKTYRLLGCSGAVDLSIGIVTIVSGLVCGVLLIINGARLLSGKKRILF